MLDIKLRLETPPLRLFGRPPLFAFAAAASSSLLPIMLERARLTRCGERDSEVRK